MILLALVTVFLSSRPLALANGWPGSAGDATRRPILFVHGGAGSGAQFEAQAQRFASNGYPASLIHVFEYDSQFKVESYEQVQARLDEKIAVIRQASGGAQLDLLGHSLGTRVAQSYLTASPEQASQIAHYVNIDGYPAETQPGDVPTLAVWAGIGRPDRSVGGAINVTIANQTHVQVATSAEAFAAYYRFFTGAEPGTTQVASESGPTVTIAGRAVAFPENVGVEASSAVAIWELDAATGRRISDAPAHAVQLRATGAFGPLPVLPGAYYELVVYRPEAPAHHFFYEPFVRSDHLVRLNLPHPGQGLDAQVDKADDHVALTIVRFKEFWGDQGAENDLLHIGEVNVINDKTSPRDNRTISLYAFDRGADKISDVSVPLAGIYGTPFMTGVDLYVPSTNVEDAAQTVRITLTPRGNAAQQRSINVPAIASSTARVTVQLRDWE